MTYHRTIHREGEPIEVAIQFERRPAGIEITQASLDHRPFVLTAEEDRHLTEWLQEHADV